MKVLIKNIEKDVKNKWVKAIKKYNNRPNHLKYVYLKQYVDDPPFRQYKNVGYVPKLILENNKIYGVFKQILINNIEDYDIDIEIISLNQEWFKIRFVILKENNKNVENGKMGH